MMSKAIFKMIPAILCCLPAAVQAQGDTQRNREELDRRPEVAIVALGPRPGRRYTEPQGGGDPIMLLAKPGETPPSRLYYRGSENRKSKWTSINIAFNNPAALRRMPEDRELRLYQKLPGEDQYEPYVTLPAVPETMRRFFFLMPGENGETPWKANPRIKVLSLDNSNLVDKHFILANFSKHPVQHAFENMVEVVAPDRTIAYQRNKVGEIYRLAARYGSEKKIIYNTAVRLSQEGHIQLFVLYDANPETNAGRDVGVFRMTIPAREGVTLSGVAAE